MALGLTWLTLLTSVGHPTAARPVTRSDLGFYKVHKQIVLTQSHTVARQT